jgi:hypothetical protein
VLSAHDKPRGPVALTDKAREVHAATFSFDGHNELPWKKRTKAVNSFAKRDIRETQPWVSTPAADTLRGWMIDANLAEADGAAAVAEATPLSNNEYKVQLAKVAVKRAIL